MFQVQAHSDRIASSPNYLVSVLPWTQLRLVDTPFRKYLEHVRGSFLQNRVCCKYRDQYLPFQDCSLSLLIYIHALQESLPRLRSTSRIRLTTQFCKALLQAQLFVHPRLLQYRLQIHCMSCKDNLFERGIPRPLCQSV